MKWYLKYLENGKQIRIEVESIEVATAIIENDLSKRENVDDIKVESDWLMGDDWIGMI